MRLLFILLLSSYLAIAYSNVNYYLGALGQSCYQTCYNQGKNCHPRIVTHNNTALFKTVGITCQPDNGEWSSEDQPSYDPVKKICRGYIGVPDATQCSASDASVQRLCRCDDPDDKALPTFGTGFSNGNITTTEKWMFQHFVTPGNIGVISHLWITYPLKVEEGLLFRYYIDGEKEASIQFTPSMACGVGFYDQMAPWGTEWFGKGANNSGWYNNFRIPFQKSIVVTVQHLYSEQSRFFFMIKGSINLPITVGGKTLPKNAKMNQARINNTYQVLEWVPLVNVPSGAGVHWMVTLAVESVNNKFLEGCIHAYLNGNTEFPGVVIGTGLEDYLDSGFFFNAGVYHLPASGYTHIFENETYISWSGYRFHDVDPMYFDNGFQLVWRNGDMDDNAGMKCHTVSGGKIHGDPTESRVYAYSWYYTWTAAETVVSTDLESVLPVKFLAVVFFVVLTLATLKNAIEFFKLIKVNVVSAVLSVPEFLSKGGQSEKGKSVSHESSSTNWTS